AREVDGDCTADAAVAAGDQRHLPVQAPGPAIAVADALGLRMHFRLPAGLVLLLLRWQLLFRLLVHLVLRPGWTCTMARGPCSPRRGGLTESVWRAALHPCLAQAVKSCRHARAGDQSESDAESAAPPVHRRPQPGEFVRAHV